MPNYAVNPHLHRGQPQWRAYPLRTFVGAPGLEDKTWFPVQGAEKSFLSVSDPAVLHSQQASFARALPSVAVPKEAQLCACCWDLVCVSGTQTQHGCASCHAAFCCPACRWSLLDPWKQEMPELSMCCSCLFNRMAQHTAKAAERASESTSSSSDASPQDSDASEPAADVSLPDIELKRKARELDALDLSDGEERQVVLKRVRKLPVADEDVDRVVALNPPQTETSVLADITEACAAPARRSVGRPVNRTSQSTREIMACKETMAREEAMFGVARGILTSSLLEPKMADTETVCGRQVPVLRDPHGRQLFTTYAVTNAHGLPSDASSRYEAHAPPTICTC